MSNEKLCTKCIHGYRASMMVFGVNIAVIWCRKQQEYVLCPGIADSCPLYESRE